MKKQLNYTSNMEYWRLKSKLQKIGYKLTADCYWTQIFEKGNRTIVLNRE
jgi:hypothetical protein